mmetsp:Transcript_19868/g.25065  ORF Transcript_19868/g.25065 Transcript_19868/m.25065 type:complete len:501 (-) Transcript_19868:1552-3054(-)|eukprot:CAMPEP_0203635948 /NCGR_PEP_ID=MMETSP0088-20131115/2604_1 /ASSEMBLY_ACC=CAM_ASM_001087 /TAXON_ID=426623 /ORGANISM="Chaetoceros affinis, Strain CCMP159" /LENGTH=500 /DNA_ID=CAMNT_0050489959 /DNA_START=122 /DNA_END=1624 /DNA_ORIENTATION=-
MDEDNNAATVPEDNDEEMIDGNNNDNVDNDGDEVLDDEAGNEGEDNANTNSGGGKPSGGGKSNHRYNRGGGGGRRYTPYTRNNRAVYHQSDDSDPSCRVYVGNLAWEVTWKELKDHMKKSECEIVRADILASPDGRSKGCGIVEFASVDGAKRALTLNDSELMGRQIFVREDRESGSGGGYYTQQPGNAPSGGFGGGGSGGGGARMSSEKQDCRVYVGNLSWDVSWQDLKDHMRTAGDVSFAEVMQEPGGRSKGCGVVEYKTPEEAKEAIDSLNDTELKGRMIFVREDRETSGGGGGRTGSAGGGGGGGGGYHGGASSTSVYVGNLAYETSWQDLKDHMRQAGNVDQANILQGEDGRSKGCGIVIYQNVRDASRAIRELQNSTLHGRPIFVREDREQGGRRSGGGARGDAGATGAAGCQLFVNNLSYDTSWKELKDHFRQCGDVERVEVIEGPDGRKKGFGTVRFYKAKDASKAIETLNGVELQGRQLEVRHDNKAGRGR